MELVKETKAHVVVRLFLGLLLLLLLLGGSSVSTTSSRGSGSGNGSGGTASNVGQQVLDVLALKSLGKEGGPDGLNLDTGSLRDLQDLVGLHIPT